MSMMSIILGFFTGLCLWIFEIRSLHWIGMTGMLRGSSLPGGLFGPPSFFNKDPDAIASFSHF